MKKSRILILTTLLSYIIILAHLSVPPVNDLLFENSIEHAHPGTGLCAVNHTHKKASENEQHSHNDEHHSHDDEHHCTYCCGHNKSLEFTISQKSVKLFYQINELFVSVIEYNPDIQIEKRETNQVYLQNVFKFPLSEHIVSSTGLRAPPLS